MTERMAAIFGPASGLPICNQFLRPTARATHGILAEVLIDLDAAVLEVNLQPCPLVEGVLAGFGEFARWQSMRSDLGDLRLEFFKEGNASLLAHRQTLLVGGSGLASFLFHGIEFAHEQEHGGGLAILGSSLRASLNFLRTWARHPARTIPGAPIFS